MGTTVVQAVLDNLYKLWPYRIIDVDEKGVFFSFGIPHEIGTGGHWFCPGLQKIEKANVVYQEIDCQIQSMETKDGQSVTFSANVGYVITDVVKWRTAVHDFDATLERLTRGILGELVEANDFSNLRGGRKSLSARLKKELTKQCEAWGVEIRNARLTDFTRTPAFRLFGGLMN